MKKLDKVILNNEEVFLKKDFLGWRVVEPIQHPETKKFIWKNFLSKKGFVMLTIILLIVGLFYLGYKEAISNYRDVMKNPCKFCTELKQEVYYGNLPNKDTINFTIVNDPMTSIITTPIIKLTEDG